VRSSQSATPTANPDAAGAAYGFAGMGPYEGGQAEHLRVPWADFRESASVSSASRHVGCLYAVT
jgi:hypothetical protein